MRWTLRHTLLTLIGLGVLAGAIAAWRLRPSYEQWTTDRAKVIDDFNDGQEPNLIGGESFTQSSSGAQVSSSLLRIKTPSPGELALALRYSLPKGTSGVWGTGLNDLDISASKSLQFWFKAEHTPLPKVDVELVDGFGGKAAVPLRHLQATDRWQHVSIPASAFQGVDFNRLARFILRLSATEHSLEGAVYLDDLALIGPPQVFFKSLEDNLYGFPHQALANPRRLLGLPTEQMLHEIARDTWGYFRDIVDHRHHLPLNYIQVKPIPLIGDYASTTDIALYLMSVVSAYDLDLIDYPSAMERVKGTLEQLTQLPKWKGFFYNYYSTTNLQITNQYISSVDNGWLAVALVIMRQAFPELTPLANRLLDPMDFKVFYDPTNGQIRLGYEMKEGRFAPYHYGLLSTEARIISAVAIGKGDLPEDHWFRVYRTLPKEWTWQRQAPKGTYKNYLGHDVFQGYYTYENGQQEIPFVPSWGGSLFEFLMPTLVIDEQRLAPQGLGLNDQRAVEIHIHYALKERGFPVWGLSPCATPLNRHGGYSEFGVAALGSKGYKDEAIVTPHVTMLAMPFAPEAAQENVRQFLRRYQMYGPYGLYDSVDVKTGDVAYRYLALDQGMSLIALANYLTNGSIQRRFSADPVMKRVEALLKVEQFFESHATARANE